MRLAWETAAAAKDFDYYLWLNDDTFLYEDALTTLLRQTFMNAIVCGTAQSIENHKTTYGGYIKNPHRLLIPNGEYQQCDYFNGNCVLISKEVFHKVGNLDPTFHHAVGDFEYGFRAKKLGIELYVGPAFIGRCEHHKELPRWRSPSVSLVNRVKSLYSPTSGCYPPQFFISDKRHNGLLVAIFHYFTIHLRVLIPKLWK
jgi:GT2 family glycosyltransferase